MTERVRMTSAPSVVALAARCRWLAWFALACLALARAVPAEDAQPAAKKAVVERGAVEQRQAAIGARKADEKKKVDNRSVQRKLRARTDLEADKLPLKDVVKKLSELHGITIRLDEAALKKANVSPDKPITVSIRNFTLALAIKHILKDTNLHYGVIDGELVIGDEPPPEPQPAPAAAPVAVEAEVVEGAGAIQLAPAMIQFNGGGEALVQQFRRQSAPLIKAELHLARSVCQPTDEQWKKIKDDVDHALKTKIEQYDAGQKKPGLRAGGGQPIVGDPLQLSRNWVHKAVQTHLTAEQAARFAEQLDRRAKARRDAGVHNVVTRIDQDLVLSTTQREEITSRLRDNWRDQWCPSLITFIQMDQWVPNIPDQYVLEFLDPAQKTIWKANRTNRTNAGGMAPAMFAGFMGGMFGQDVFWENEPEAGGPGAGGPADGPPDPKPETRE